MEELLRSNVILSLAIEVNTSIKNRENMLKARLQRLYVTFLPTTTFPIGSPIERHV
jgi:hypothetical protein